VPAGPAEQDRSDSPARGETDRPPAKGPAAGADAAGDAGRTEASRADTEPTEGLGLADLLAGALAAYRRI
jgi:hypothetical protein